MVFNVENKNIKIVIPENESYVRITKECEEYEIVFHDNVESLSIDDDCGISIEKIKSFGIKNLKNLKLGIMKEYLIEGFDNLELLLLPEKYPKKYEPVLKINNPSLKTIILSPKYFKNGRFHLNHGIEKFLSHKSKGQFISLQGIDLNYITEGFDYFSCVFFESKSVYHEKLLKKNIDDELKKTKIELEQLKNKYDELLKEKEDISSKYEKLLKFNKNHTKDLKTVLEMFSKHDA